MPTVTCPRGCKLRVLNTEYPSSNHYGTFYRVSPRNLTAYLQAEKGISTVVGHVVISFCFMKWFVGLGQLCQMARVGTAQVRREIPKLWHSIRHDTPWPWSSEFWKTDMVLRGLDIWVVHLLPSFSQHPEVVCIPHREWERLGPRKCPEQLQLCGCDQGFPTYKEAGDEHLLPK